MGHLRLVHSFNTRPLSIDCYGVDSLKRLAGNIWYHALSVAYAKSVGAEIVLHTDTLGKALLGHLPYDEIYLTLDDMPRDVHPRFWAAGKMWALDAEPIGSVHIDGDVFIKRKTLLADMVDSDWDFIAQNYESGEWYEKECTPFDRYPDICHHYNLDPHSIGAYNTGVIGFRDKVLKDDYIGTYKNIVLMLSRLCRTLLDTSSDLTPDCILEQRHSYQVCQRHNAKVKLILPDPIDLGHQAGAIGYQHIMTSAKFAHLDKCIVALQRLSPEIFRKTELLCKNILKK